MSEYPFCSVIVLNYFGEKVIKNAINSLLNLNFPQEKLEVIIVDNGSKDKSHKILSEISKQHSNIKLIFLEKNLGFTKGNNIGIKQAVGKYVALLNNDCVVEKDWLKELIELAEKDSGTFAVSSKVLLFPKYFNLSLIVDQGLTPIYALLSKSNLYQYSNNKVYLPLWRGDSTYKIEIPVDSILDEFVEILVLFSLKRKILKKDLIPGNLFKFDESTAEVKKIKTSKGDLAVTFRINTKSKFFLSKAKDKVQNAGIIVFQDGYGRDIGSIIRYSNQYYEYDRGQYEKEAEIYAACGAAVLFRRDLLEKLGFLDESFFMYYDDVDICEKARIAGYKIFYCPKAVARHLHALSSGEWSPFFIYHVEKGRLLHVFYNFPLTIFLKEYMELFLKTLINAIIFLLKSLKYRYLVIFFGKSRSVPQGSSDYKKRIQYIYALLYFFAYLFYLIPKRVNFVFKRDNKKVNENYQRILEGEWYSK